MLSEVPAHCSLARHAGPADAASAAIIENTSSPAQGRLTASLRDVFATLDPVDPALRDGCMRELGGGVGSWGRCARLWTPATIYRE